MWKGSNKWKPSQKMLTMKYTNVFKVLDMEGEFWTKVKTPQGEKKQELPKNIPKPGLRPGWDPQFLISRRGLECKTQL